MPNEDSVAGVVDREEEGDAADAVVARTRNAQLPQSPNVVVVVGAAAVDTDIGMDTSLDAAGLVNREVAVAVVAVAVGVPQPHKTGVTLFVVMMFAVAAPEEVAAFWLLPPKIRYYVLRCCCCCCSHPPAIPSKHRLPKNIPDFAILPPVVAEVEEVHSWVLSKLAAASHLLDHYQTRSLVAAMTSFPYLPPLMSFLLEPPSVQLELPLLLVVVMPPCPLFLLRCDWNPNVGALPRDWEGKTF